MATINIYLKTDYKSKDLRYPIYVKLRSKAAVKNIPVGFKVKDTEWNDAEKKVIKHEDRSAINAKISDIVRELNLQINDSIITGKPIDLKRMTKPGKASFTDYLTHRAGQYKQTGQLTMAGRVDWVVKELTELFDNLYFSDLTTEHLRKYHAYLRAKNHTNTIYKRFSMLRQMFTNAVNEGVYVGINPFINYKVKTTPVRKEKLTVRDIELIENASLPEKAAIARDMFMFAYYCKGIRFENCVLLQNNDIINGRIYIKTNKGEKPLSVLIHPKLQMILDRYSKTGFVFPYVDEMPKPEDRRRVLDQVNVIVNHALKIVASTAGVTETLSFHLSRHALAYHLKQQGVAISSISDILGHSSVRITEMYLKSLDDEALDSEMDKVYK